MTAEHRLGNKINTKARGGGILVPEFGGGVDNLIQLRVDVGVRVWI